MRTAFFPLLALALPAVAADPPGFSVVVHASDQVVARYVCAKDNSIREEFTLRTELRKEGRFNWHVVGGEAPYTVLNDEMTLGTTRCITVQDANGQVATACAIMGTREEIVEVECPWIDNNDSLWHGRVPDKASDAQRPDGIAAPERLQTVNRLDTQVPAPKGDALHYLPPVKQREVTYDPPPPPDHGPDVTRVKQETKQVVPGTVRPGPPKTPRHRPTPRQRADGGQGVMGGGTVTGTPSRTPTTTPAPSPSPKPALQKTR